MKQRVPFIARFIVFLLVMVASTAFGGENSLELNYGIGILNIRSQSVGTSFRLALPLLVPGDIKQGWQTFAQTTWSNIWAQNESYLIDYEMLDSTLGFSYGLNQRLGMGVMVASRAYFGGEMDSVIQEFHDLLGVGQSGRNYYKKGRSAINEYNPVTGDLIGRNSAHGLNNSGINLFANYNFIQNNRMLPGVNIYCVARYAFDSADIVTKENGLDLGLGVGLAKKWNSDFYTYAIAGYTLFDDQGETNNTIFELKDHQFTGFFAMAYLLSENAALLAQYLYSTSVIERIQGLDEPSHELHLGLKFRIGKRSVMDFSIIENIITMDNSPDFGIHLAWRLEL